MKINFPQVRKAVVGFVTPAVVVFGEALIREGFTPANVNWSQTVTMAAVAAVLTAFGVYKVRNATGQPGGSLPPDPDSQPRYVDGALGQDGVPPRPITHRPGDRPPL